jgi:glycosyltransferase involved in cell wall biosynthesis
VKNERNALHRALLVIANSARTKRDLVRYVGVSADRVRTVYLGVDPDEFRPPTEAERAAARRDLGWAEERPKIVFVGALGDRRKGFDTLFATWELLCTSPDWDADLVVVGTGAELPFWRARARENGLGNRVQFLGFRQDVAHVLHACDALIAPTRYESYGLGVQEALCCGLPALVSSAAGVAERYPVSLRDLLISDPEDTAALARSLRDWRQRKDAIQAEVISFSQVLRAHTWERMAAEIVTLIDETA